MFTGRTGLFASTCIYLCVSSRPGEALLCKERLCCYPTRTKLQSRDRNPGKGRAVLQPWRPSPTQSPSKATAAEDAPEAPNPSVPFSAEHDFFYKHHHQLPALSQESLPPDHHPGWSRWLCSISLGLHCLSPGGGRGTGHLHRPAPPSPKPLPSPAAPRGTSTQQAQGDDYFISVPLFQQGWKWDIQGRNCQQHSPRSQHCQQEMSPTAFSSRIYRGAPAIPEPESNKCLSPESTMHTGSGTENLLQSPTLVYQVSKEATLTCEGRATRPGTLKPQFQKKFKLMANFEHKYSVSLSSTKSVGIHLSTA